MKKTIVHLARHGEVHNPEQVFYGRIPGFRLSDTGREQADRLGKFLSTRNINAIFASPLDRTVETATIVSWHFPHLKVQTDERIIEIKSPIEGKPLTEAAVENWNLYCDDFLAQGGETMDQIWERMHDFIEEKKRDFEGQEILAISHGDPIMLSRAHHLGLPFCLDSIRGDLYISTAHGVRFIYDDAEIIVENIDPV